MTEDVLKVVEAMRQLETTRKLAIAFDQSVISLNERATDTVRPHVRRQLQKKLDRLLANEPPPASPAASVAA